MTDYRCDYCRTKNRDFCPDAIERERAATREALDSMSTAPDPDAPGTMITTDHPTRYSTPFYVGNQLVVICQECSVPSHAVMVLAFDVANHDDYHSSEEALEIGG